eukprot:7053036-Prymnesium_polylepis.3
MVRPAKRSKSTPRGPRHITDIGFSAGEALDLPVGVTGDALHVVLAVAHAEERHGPGNPGMQSTR